MNYNFRKMKSDAKTPSIMFDVYIALAVIPEIFDYDQISIENKVDTIINNITIAPQNLKQAVMTEVAQIMQYLSIHNYGNTSGTISGRGNTYEYGVLFNIGTSIKLLEEIYIKNTTNQLPKTINNDIMSMLSSFDLKNNTKVNKTNGTGINNIVNGKNNITSTVNRLLSKVLANKTPTTQPPATAPAKTPVKVEKPNHNANTKKIIGEHIACQLIIDGHLYNEDAQIDLIAYYRNIFNVEKPEIEDEKGSKIMTYCSNVLNNETILSGNNDFNFHQIFNFEKFAENIVNYKLDKIDETFFYKETKKIGSDIYVGLNALNNILIDNNDNGISREALKYIVQNGIDNKDIKHKEINQKNKKDKNYSNKPIEDNNENIKEKTMLEKFLKWSKIK